MAKDDTKDDTTAKDEKDTKDTKDKKETKSKSKKGGLGSGAETLADVPANMATELDPPIVPVEKQKFGDKELVTDPKTRGVMLGKDRNKDDEEAEKAEKSAKEAAQKEASKKKDDEEEGPELPAEVQEKKDAGEELKDETAKRLAKQTEDNAKAQAQAGRRP